MSEPGGPRIIIDKNRYAAQTFLLILCAET
jgi:hypothetical protein